jgi:hypothetical protein
MIVESSGRHGRKRGVPEKDHALNRGKHHGVARERPLIDWAYRVSVKLSLALYANCVKQPRIA